MDLKPCDYSVKTFHFTDEEDIIYLSCSSSDSLCDEKELHTCGLNCINVKVKEIPDQTLASTGMHVWPSAPVLGKYVWHNRYKFKNKTVIELGAGTGLVSIVATKCGVAKCIVSDSSVDVLKVVQENLNLNKCSNYSLQYLSWGYLCPHLIFNKNVDFILGSDVFYDPKDFENIIFTVSYLMNQNPLAEFWCAYERRCSEWNIQHLIGKWNLLCEEVPLESFGGCGTNIADSGLPGLKEIRLFVFRSKQLQPNTKDDSSKSIEDVSHQIKEMEIE